MSNFDSAHFFHQFEDPRNPPKMSHLKFYAEMTKFSQYLNFHTKIGQNR